MKFLGIKNLILSNASGGVNPDYEVGDLMILEDHICLIPNPLIGTNLDELGPRFPDMSDPYDKNMIQLAEKIAYENNLPVQKGVYIALTGPTLETPAEYKYMRIIGGDTVGMSTAPEVIVARHMGIPCFAMSVITDLGVPGKIQKVTHEEIQKVSEVAEPKLTLIIKQLISKI
jgi:purine-nucleoside phosphorylase